MLARDDPHAIVRANVDGTANLLELARIHSIGRLIFCSSAGVYGATQGGPVLETDPLRPRDTYSVSKAASEHIVAAYAHQFGLDAVSLRFSWIFGPRHRLRHPYHDPRYARRSADTSALWPRLPPPVRICR